MAWNDSLLPASFRGVPFFYEDTKRTGGRRLVEHEFPQRDDPFVEDLGRKKKEHHITGYVLGDDYIEQRASLEAALDGPEFGTLVHPYRGALKVNIRTWISQEVRDEGRMARFDIDCVETGTSPSPLSTIFTSGDSLGSSDDSLDQIVLSFDDNWIVGANTVSAASDLLDQLDGAFATLINWPDIDTDALAPLVADLSDMATDGVAVATAITGFFSGYADAALATEVAPDQTLTSRGPQPLNDHSYGLTAMAGWGAGLASPDASQIGLNQQALVALVSGSAVIALGRIYAQTKFAAQEDADSARDLLASLIDGLATSAADAGDDRGFLSWQSYYQAAVDDLTTRAKQAPSTLTFTMGIAMPALALAQRLYQDPSRGDELVARNDAPHPLFVPPVVQALTS
ncbi:MAG TPA: DNA circularization N-terminal domain-containing protein [Rhizomicrobium sp.]|nr:DNA circularization N-terminal domain-containing protein [Rhizomicrobium sp.]